MEERLLGEALLRDVAQWLSPADLRRARLVCKAWRSALGTLSTKASTPPDASTVTKWKAQLESMVTALPCLQQLTIGSKLSAVGAQQLAVLAEAKQLRALHIPHGQALQDRSLQALAPLAATLQELHIKGATSLSSRCLLVLSVLGRLEVLELRNCGKVSWHELQRAWQLACLAYEAQAADGGSAAAPTSGAGSSVVAKIGGWLPTGGLFRVSSPSSSAIQSALAKQQQPQRSGGGLLGKVPGKGLLGGAVGNGRSSTGGSSHEGAVRKLLYRKLKLGAAAAAAAAPGDAPLAAGAAEALGVQAAAMQRTCETVTEGSEESEAAGAAGSSVEPAGAPASCPAEQHSAESGAAAGTAVGAAAAGRVVAALPASPPAAAPVAAALPPQPQRSSGLGHASALYKVGSLVWQGTTAAAAALNLSSGSSITRQSSTVQTALMAYLSEADGPPPVAARSSSSSGSRNSTNGSSNSGDGGGSRGNSISGSASAAGGSSSGSSGGSSSKVKLLLRRRRSSDSRPLPAMPFTKLASLSFTCSEATFKNPGPELAAIGLLTTLTHLELSKCKLPDSAFWQLTSLTRLAKLKLSGLWLMGDAGLQQVARLSGLRSLALSEAMYVTAAGLLALSSLTGVTSLALGLTQDLGSGSLARAANSLPQLRCLEVTAPCWDDIDCQLLAAADSTAAAGAASTSSVSLSSSPVGGQGLQQQLPLMLWQLPLARSDSSKAGAGGGLLSASSSRSNSSMNLRASSFSSTNSFGSFSSAHFGPSVIDLVRRPVPAAPGAGCAAAARPLLVLRLHGCRALTHRGLEALRRLPELHTLVVDGCKEVHAAEAVSQDLLPPKLAALSLRNTVFGNVFSGCVSVPACGASLTRLELVSQGGAHVGQMRRLLSFFPQLRELSVAGCVDLGEQLLCHLPLLPRLAALTLSGTRVTGEAFDQLVHLRELRLLRCRGCNLLTDAGLGLLALVPGLQELDVGECGGLSERGLLAVMLNAPALVRLDVSGCRAVSRELVQCCPHFLHLLHGL